MKTNEVIEGCKTLSEFMGENEAHASIGFIYPRDECFPLSGRKFKESAVEDEVLMEVEEFGGTLSVTTSNYNNDWSLLMPVVEKIESLNFSTEIYSMGCDNHRMTVYSGGAIVFQSRLVESKIQSVFQACVSFAKWYKNQPK